MVNLATSIALFQFDGITPLYFLFHAGLQIAGLALPYTVDDFVFFCLLAPVLLPVALFLLLTMVALQIPASLAMSVVLWVTLVLNAAIWGDSVMFFRRLIQTGDVRVAWSHVFRWARPVRQPADV